MWLIQNVASGQIIELSQTTVTFGRAVPGAVPDIAILDNRVSRNHAVIESGKGAVRITRISNGELKINGHDVVGTILLKKGDVISIFDNSWKILNSEEAVVNKSKVSKIIAVIAFVTVSIIIVKYFGTISKKAEGSAFRPASGIVYTGHASLDEGFNLMRERIAVPQNRYYAWRKFKNADSIEIGDSIRNVRRISIALLEREMDSIVSVLETRVKIGKMEGRTDIIEQAVREGLQLFPEPTDRRRAQIRSFAE